MNEKLFHRLLRTAAWITVLGVVMGTSLEWMALLRAREASDQMQRQSLIDNALGIAVFWTMLWISLPIGAIAFWRHIGWIERIPALVLPALAIARVVVALARSHRCRRSELVSTESAMALMPCQRVRPGHH